MPLSTRAKNATQHPGVILLADMRKRRTKEEVAADIKKKKLDDQITKAGLERLYQFIADEEDQLAEDEVNAHGKKPPPSLCSQQLDHQNAPTVWDSDNECEVDANTKQDRKKNAIDDESVEAFSTNDNKGDGDGEAAEGDGDREAAEGDGEKALKKRRTDAYEAIQALRKRPNVDSQTIYKSAAGIPSHDGKASERRAMGNNKITAEKPSGLLAVKAWTTGVAKPCGPTGRERSLTFGPGTRDWSSVTGPRSRATSASSTTTRTPSSATTSHELHSESGTLSSLGDEKVNLKDLQSVLGKRSNSTAVKVEDSDVSHPKKQSGRTTQAQVEGSKRTLKYTNNDLPQGALENNDWRKKFITTYVKWLGAHAGPWVDSEEENVAAMQAIWNTVYPHIDHTIDVDGPVYYIAQQRASEWRSGFGSNAVALFKFAFESKGFSPEDKLTTAVQLLDKSAFLYAKPKGGTQQEFIGIFRSPMILQLFASHYDSISGAVRVPSLEPSFSDDQLALIDILEGKLKSIDPDCDEALAVTVKLDTIRMYPMGALAICTVAVERAVNLFAAPADSASATNANTFSRKWNKRIQKYREIIKITLRDGTMENIIGEALSFMKAGTNITASVMVSDDIDDDMMDLDLYVDL